MIPLFKVRTNTEVALELIEEVLRSGYVGQGPKVDEFERQLASVLAVPEWSVVTVNSGTAALQLALMLCNAKGRDVILPPVTCTADPHAVLAEGARIEWCDIGWDGLADQYDAMKRVRAFRMNTAAYMPTDWGGCVPEVAEFRRQFPEIPIIQDAAHNFTGELYGDYTALSFQAIKHLHTGDGGALIVHNKKKAEEARLRRWFSLDRKSNADFRCSQNAQWEGRKMHMNDITAALGLANLPLAIDSVRVSRDNARFYETHLSPLCRLPFQSGSPYWIYTILVDDRDGFQKKMAELGVATSPVHAICTKHDVFRKYHRDLFVAEGFCKKHVAIPNGWWVTPDDREQIAESVRRCL